MQKIDTPVVFRCERTLQSKESDETHATLGHFRSRRSSLGADPHAETAVAAIDAAVGQGSYALARATPPGVRPRVD